MTALVIWLLFAAPELPKEVQALAARDAASCAALADLPPLRQALAQFPASPELLEALHHCTRALDEALPEGWPDRRRALLEEVAAIERAQAAAETPDAQAFVFLGRVLVRLDRLPEALEAFDRADALDPSSLRGLKGALEVLVRQGRAQEAEQRVQLWLSASEGDARATGAGHALRAWVLAEEGRVPEAVALAEKSGRSDAKAQAYMRARAWAKAARAWRAWRKGAGGSAGRDGLLLCLAKLGRREELDAVLGPEDGGPRELLEWVMADPEAAPLPPQETEDDLPSGIAPEEHAH